MYEADRPALGHVTDHVDRGLARLTAQFRKPAIEAVLASHLAEMQEVEDALWSILLLSLDTAENAQLDQLAALLGEPRAGLDDDALRTVLRGRVLANRSSGTTDELHAILGLFAGTGYALTAYFPAALVAELATIPAVPAERIGSLLRRAVAGGVGAALVAPAFAFSSSGFTFASGEDVETDSFRGWSDVTGLDGGALSGVY